MWYVLLGIIIYLLLPSWKSMIKNAFNKNKEELLEHCFVSGNCVSNNLSWLENIRKKEVVTGSIADFIKNYEFDISISGNTVHAYATCKNYYIYLTCEPKELRMAYLELLMHHSYHK